MVAGARCEFLVPAPEKMGFLVAAEELGWTLVLVDLVRSEQLVQPHQTVPLWGNAASPEFCKHQELPPYLHKISDTKATCWLNFRITGIHLLKR